MPSNEHCKELYIQLMRTVEPQYINIPDGDKDFELFEKIYNDAHIICNERANG